MLWSVRAHALKPRMAHAGARPVPGEAVSKRKSSSRGGLWFTCLCLLALLSGCARVGAASADSGPSAPGPDDGPYAFYSGEAGLDLYWLCGGELVEHRQGVGEPVPAKCGFPKSVVAGPPADADPQVRFEADRIAALSDIHGQFDVLVELLRNNGVIGEDLDWAFGDGHLVVAGDMFDRGGRQTEVLWLLYRLEQQAHMHGGRVHTLLGNHEVLVLRDDLRYLHPKYHVVSELLGRGFPKLYGEDTVLGAWLRARPVIVKINDIMFTHAGLHPDFLELGLSTAEVNDSFRGSLGLPREEVMETPVLDFLHGPLGPVWYRGYFRDQDGVSEQQLNQLAEALRISRIVVGHTSFDGIHEHHGGRVINIDSNIKRGKSGEILLWEDSEFSVGNQAGLRSRVPDWDD